MYNVALYLHSYTRWLVIVSIVWALWRAWGGLLRGREWVKQDRVAGLTVTMLTSLQFILGVILYLSPNGLAQAAVQDFAAAMSVRDLRFFGIEHPLQMIIVLFLTHLASARSKRASTTRKKFRWGAACYSLTMLLVLTAIPWWRPLFRLPAPLAQTTAPAALRQAQEPGTLVDLPQGDATRGGVLFAEGADGAARCAVCHTLDDQKLVGPGLANIGIRAAERVDGQAAESYLYQSITDPAAYVVDGYVHVMPENYGEALSEQEIADLIAFLRTIP
ncbi:MAG: c-type cytochrome [Ardenticatenaceae bacterium]